MAHHADAEVAECVRCPMMRRRYLAGIFVKVQGLRPAGDQAGNVDRKK